MCKLYTTMFSLIDVCRICLIENTPLININTVCEHENIKWVTKLECILPEIDFYESNLSNSLCEACCNKLKFVYEFKQQCINNNMLLQLHKNTSVQEFKYEEESIEDKMETNTYTEEGGLLGFRVVNNGHVPVYGSTEEQKENIFTELEFDSRTNVEDYKSKTVRVTLCDIKHDLENILKTTKISPKSLNLIKNNGTNKCLKVISPEKLNGKKFDKTRKKVIQTSQNNQIENVQTTQNLNETKTDNLLDINSLQCIIINEQSELEKLLKEQSMLKHKKIKNPILDEYEVVEVRIFQRNTRTYSCNVCAKSFQTNARLKKHESVHMDTRPFKCSDCSLRFHSGDELKTHRRMHKRAFECADCGRRYRSRNGLNDHRRVHTGELPYSCGTCDLRFKSFGQFKYHMRKLHDRLSPYRCDACSATFPHKLLLIKHSAVHNDSLPFQCQVCHYYFANEKCFYKHLLKHSKEECSAT